MRSFCLYFVLFLWTSLVLGEFNKKSIDLNSFSRTVKSDEDDETPTTIKFLFVENRELKDNSLPYKFTTDFSHHNFKLSPSDSQPTKGFINFGNIDGGGQYVIYGKYEIEEGIEAVLPRRLLDDDTIIKNRFYSSGLGLLENNLYILFGGLNTEDEFMDDFADDAYIFNAFTGAFQSIPFDHLYYGQKSIYLENEPGWIADEELSYKEGGLAFFGRKDADGPEPIASNDVYLVYLNEGDVIMKHDLTDKIVEENEEVPLERYHHAITYFDGKVYLFGGATDDPSVSDLDDFWMLDVETLKWTEITKENDDTPWPSKRHGHSLTKIKDNESNDILFLHGGRFTGEDGFEYLGDVWVYNLTSSEWKVYYNESEIFFGRAFHYAIPDEPYTVVVAGGMNEDGNIDKLLSYMNIIIVHPKEVNPPLSQTEEFGGNRPVPNHVIAGVAGGLFLVLLVAVIILGLKKRG